MFLIDTVNLFTLFDLSAPVPLNNLGLKLGYAEDCDHTA